MFKVSNLKFSLTILSLLAINLSVFGQKAPFNIAIEPVSIDGLGGIQSFAFGQADNKWLVIGGRLDGLHRRQPFAAFDIAGHNNQLIVVDPVSLKKWTAPLTSLPSSIQEQLSSTNMNFYQDRDYLYCIGGYGYSATAADHTTFANLTAIKVSDVISAVINGKSFSSYFRQINDPLFQVTGGHLKKIYDTYYLLGGQKFIGRYNPQGPDHGPGFVQDYTNAIRKFSITDNGTTISIRHLPSYIDTANLHRRDYNAESQILPNGQEAITMFSGVFQINNDLPYLNSVTVDSNSYAANDSFQQYYNHYHCAVLPLYSEASRQMHTVFFGGIAQYYDNAGTLTQDNNVPFVKTIARVTRDSNSKMAEFKLPVEMPALLGAGSEFIPNTDIPHFNNEVLKLDRITEDSTLVGYIFGGISSSGANIFFTNTGLQSTASSQIFKVYITNNNLLSVHQLNAQSIGTLKMLVYPNPNYGTFAVKYYLKEKCNVVIKVSDITGKIIRKEDLKNMSAGENIFQQKITNLEKAGTYNVTIETPYERATQHIIID